MCRSVLLELSTRSPGSLLKDESLVGVFALEKWNETLCLHMGQHICCMIGSILVLIITLLTFVLYVEASSQLHSSSNKREQCGRLAGYPLLGHPRRSLVMLVRRVKEWRQLQCPMSSDIWLQSWQL